jgi:AcrR family transcriptional regulator
MTSETDKQPSPKAVGVRARVRAELTAEIKAVATRQLASAGASSLSLRAISRELGMASSAIYRYFTSRDDLLTALIIDAYNAVGDAADAADQACESTDHRGRFIAIAHAIRSWATQNPHQYALIYGSPVPGYAAPEDTIDPATRNTVALLTVVVDALGASEPRPVESELGDALAQLNEFTDYRLTPEQLGGAVRAWGEIIGMISLELFGHFNNAVTEPASMFAYAVDSLADRTLEP